MRRQRLSRAFRQRGKLLAVWGLILLLALWGTTKRACEAGSAWCEVLSHRGPYLFAATLVLCALILYWRRQRRLYYSGEPTLRDQPWEFDQQEVVLTGKIEKLFEDHIIEHAKRKFRDWYRRRIGNSDGKGRYIHQRFLMSADQLKRGHVILVEHNVKFGKVELREGARVEVQGEYLHTTVKDNFYGRVHFTHKPKGYIKLL